MQECDACGLLFGGDNECPSCGSRISHAPPESTDDPRDNRPVGPLPGDSALNDVMEGIEGLDISITAPTPTGTTTSLPFQVGGTGQSISSLPFGVGAPAGVIIESESDIRENPVIETSSEKSPEITPEITAEITPDITPEKEPEEDDPWALPEPEEAPVLQASISLENGEVEPPLMVLQARVVEPEEEQLSDSPILVENAYQIKAAAFDAEHIYAVEEDVIIHDFGDELQVSEVVVNFDELVDPAEQTIRFDPEMLSEGEPELLPAKALPINDGGDPNISNQTATAFSALGEGRWKDAADEFRSVCNALPGNPEALNDFGLSLLQLAIQVHEVTPTATPAEEPHFEAAVLALRQAAQQDKHNPTILYNLATCLSTCGRHGVADRIWDAAISLSPDDAAPLNGKAVSLIALGEFDAATSLLIRARELSPSEAVIIRNLRRLRPTE